MTKRMSIAEAKDHLTALVHEVEAGTVIELTRRGKPVARLVGLHGPEGREPRPKRFIERVMQWREAHEIERYGLTDEDMEGLRDASPGREFGF